MFESKYKKEQFVKLSWDEYGQLLEKLLVKVKTHLETNTITIDAVMPILRGGAFPGGFLASRLKVLRILPVQYKYFFEDGKVILKKIFGLDKVPTDLGKSPTILLVENNHCFGLTASTAAKDLKTLIPNCKILYAADNMDYSYQKNEYADAIFYGELTNDTLALTEEEAKRKGLLPTFHLYPWETIEEEWTTVQGKQFEYSGYQQIGKTAETKVEINLSEIFN